MAQRASSFDACILHIGEVYFELFRSLAIISNRSHPVHSNLLPTSLVRKAMKERIGTAVPMGRMGRPEEIADGVVYLSGGRSSIVTGTALFVDGGYTQR